MRGRPQPKGLQKETELRLRLRLTDPEHPEDPLLRRPVVDPDAAASDLESVDDQVVGQGERRSWIAFHRGELGGPRRSKALDDATQDLNGLAEGLPISQTDHMCATRIVPAEEEITKVRERNRALRRGERKLAVEPGPPPRAQRERRPQRGVRETGRDASGPARRLREEPGERLFEITAHEEHADEAGRAIPALVPAGLVAGEDLHHGERRASIADEQAQCQITANARRKLGRAEEAGRPPETATCLFHPMRRRSKADRAPRWSPVLCFRPQRASGQHGEAQRARGRSERSHGSVTDARARAVLARTARRYSGARGAAA